MPPAHSLRADLAAACGAQARWQRLKRSARFPFVGRSCRHVAKVTAAGRGCRGCTSPLPSQQPSRAAWEVPTPLTPRTTLALRPPLILRPGHRCQHAASAWVRPWRCLRRRPPPPRTPAGAALPHRRYRRRRRRRHCRRRRRRRRRRCRRRRRPPASAPGTSLQSVRGRGKKMGTWVRDMVATRAVAEVGRWRRAAARARACLLCVVAGRVCVWFWWGRGQGGAAATCAITGVSQMVRPCSRLGVGLGLGFGLG